MNTFEEVQDVFREVFQDDDLVIEDSTSADDIEDWDSLRHVTLIVQVERATGVRFTSSEVAELKNVGQLVALVDSKKS